MNLLLLSNSMTDAGYLTHALPALTEIGSGAREAAFVPYAGVTIGWDSYEEKVQEALAPIGLRISSVHRANDPAQTVRDAALVLVGGGNTFNLLAHCRRTGVLAALRERVRAGKPYAGWSAGALLACPTIRTTNDMPIADPDGLDAIGAVAFQINAHYTSQVLPGHRGETRDQRLAEFLQLNPAMPVLALPEGDWLRLKGTQIALGGPHPAYWLRHNHERVTLRAGPLALP